MDQNLTALVSCFARAYHFENEPVWVFRDEWAGQLLRQQEYQAIASNMADGISFFDPTFHGDREAALRFLVDHYLAPPVLARSAFCQRSLETARRLGCAQLVLFGAGYDSFSLQCRAADLHVFELDRPEMSADKQARVSALPVEPDCTVSYLPCDLAGGGWPEGLRAAGFRPDRTAFGALLGLSYYLTASEFQQLLERIASLFCAGSSLVFDYPTPAACEASQKNRALAQGANQQMRAQYTCAQIEAMLDASGFLIYEHLDAEEMARGYFADHNARVPQHPILPPEGVHYCLAVKKHP